MSLIVSGTGHRPNKLGGYGVEVRKALRTLAYQWLKEHKPAKVISGMALGWDQALASAATDWDIPFIAAVPFSGQESMWPAESKDLYNALLGRASQVVITSPGSYSAAKMQIRNEWMVNNSNHVLALWNGTPGGTANCVKYAQKQEKAISNLWQVWVTSAR